MKSSSWDQNLGRNAEGCTVRDTLLLKIYTTVCKISKKKCFSLYLGMDFTTAKLYRKIATVCECVSSFQLDDSFFILHASVGHF